MGGDDGSGDKEAAAPAVSGFRKVVWIVQMIHRWRQSSAARRSKATAGDVGETSGNARAEQQNDDTDAAAANDDHNNDDDKKPLLPPAKVVVVEERGGGGETEPVTPMTPDGQPADVPRGCCAVYVGAEPERRRRFVVPTAYLGMPVFRRLLEKAEEEFGFEYSDGALTIPCETEDFKYILVVMDRHQKGLVDDEGNPKDAASEGSSEKRG
ncbi:hypothetical protein E2562_029928 [Oryza meyeriana var. granulata]|uniref:Auxin-responsive protein n=1 Tax=Oryza meyeriana var. granulata TaxID=110450 RepID=A0A6G1CUH6_9ORYZ|nr:hypothetical protein E2562_029928 [Oryza meyeriana var. granulata]KAF0903827.1 hypothetical protein E2562_029928 [Oryza meyeriana var. granulata]KAF0903828.1 hypothetical protein E2562_029928 [Oryza meyeriana var. granulata]